MDKINFWNNKILTWEKKRFSHTGPIKERMLVSLSILQKKFGKDPITIVEFGCASGIMAEELIKLNPNIKYYGFDFSASAIENAKSKNLPNCAFFCLNIEDGIKKLKELNLSKIDCLVSLGLLDWLNPDERNQLKNVKSDYMIHSFSVNNHLLTLAHKIFVFFTYGYKQPEYVPIYESKEDIQTLFGKKLFFYQNKTMNIACLASDINVKVENA